MPIDGEPHVFLPVKNETTKFARRAVRVGSTVGGWTPILAGVNEGDRVVTRGAFVIKAQFMKPPEEAD
jgi:cobalt-zinc-cadmium efflux system membrane fusion protein